MSQACDAALLVSIHKYCGMCLMSLDSCPALRVLSVSAEHELQKQGLFEDKGTAEQGFCCSPYNVSMHDCHMHVLSLHFAFRGVIVSTESESDMEGSFKMCTRPCWMGLFLQPCWVLCVLHHACAAYNGCELPIIFFMHSEP